MPGLEDLYREIILDHYRNPRNNGTLECPPAHHAEGFNPLCGDEVAVYVDVSDGRVNDVRITGQGCSISKASASMMSVAVKGKSVNEARSITRAFKGMMSIHENELDGSRQARPTTTVSRSSSAISKRFAEWSSSRRGSNARRSPGTPSPSASTTPH